MLFRTILAILAMALPGAAPAQWHLNFATKAECMVAAAVLLGPAGGTKACTTTSTHKVTVAPTGVPIAAVCDGVADNSAAIKEAIDKAKALGVPVLVPAGTCAYGDVITLDGVKMIGRGDASVLFSLNVNRAAIFLRGSGSEVRNVKLAGVTPTVRAAPFEGSRIVPLGATQFVIDNVTITSSTGAGIISSRSSSNGVISNNRISGTLADAIHLTDKSSYITVMGNRIEGSGDDGIAVVSYQAQGGLVHHITAVGNVVSNNKGGRSMSVVGGADVLYENNRLSNSGNGACMYLAQEDSYKTLAVKNIVVRYNALTNCGGPTLGHAAVMLFTGTMGPNENVALVRNDIVQGPTQVGIRVFGNNAGVTLDSNRISGAGTALRLPADLIAVPYTSGPVGVR